MFRKRRARPVRVCFAAVLRILDDDRIVLFESESRPGAFAPPGGVLRYDQRAADTLRRLDFSADHKHHLRGTLPVRSVDGLVRWFTAGVFREDGAQCLRRALAEYGPDMSVTRLSTEVECSGPELRGFEFFDLVGPDRVRDRIVARARDSRVHPVRLATAEEVARGRIGEAIIAPHTRCLMSRTPTPR